MDPHSSTPLVNVYSKLHTKEFSTNAAKLTSSLYLSEMEVTITPHVIKRCKIVHVFHITGESGTVGATMLCEYGYGQYRVMGLAVADKRKGYGTALMKSLIEFVPKGTKLVIGVDTGKESTEWLLKWYTSMGFEIFLKNTDETVLCKIT